MGKRRIYIVVLIIIVFVIAIIASHIYYDNKLVVSFETGTDEKIMNQYLSKNSIIKEPTTPTKDGYIFVGWQKNGENFDFDNKIKKDTTLSAKWVKEEYVYVDFITDTKDIIETRKYIKGSVLTDLPSPSKENYEFIGWYIDDSIYDNREVNSDLTLIAKYKKCSINSNYKVGDNVVIIGSYSDSSYAVKDYYDVAIGWHRKILDIYEDSEFPYMVGDDTGVTGFFKAESIEIVK